MVVMELATAMAMVMGMASVWEKGKCCCPQKMQTTSFPQESGTGLIHFTHLTHLTHLTVHYQAPLFLLRDPRNMRHIIQLHMILQNYYR